MSRFEVLSPVGNGEMLIAACRAGADAVYLGAKDFSARRNAENFEDNELKEAIKYCHIRGVKVYLTLNIQIKDGELSSAVDLARSAYNYGIDGVIIADLGLADILHRLIPKLPLHASTQMTVHTPAALKTLKNAGFTRVVAAREMSREELKELCKRARELDIEVEVFVHGALCMSVSGQCLLSAFLGSRSGNRGLCAGPCRLPFEAKGGTGYDLSLKDRSLLPHIKELCDMGVTSFKIEGRMKRPEYVAAATAACRFAVDNGYVPAEALDTLKNVFSRSGFTDGYYVNRLGRDMFGIRTKEDVTAADKAFPKIHELIRAERRTVKIKAEIRVKSDMPVTLTLWDGENRVTARGEIPKPAQNRPITPETLKSGVDKFGSTPYILEEFSACCDDGLFVSAAELNAIRREAVELLDRERSEVHREESRAEYTLTEGSENNTAAPKFYVRFEDISQIPKCLSGIDGVIFPLEKDFDINIEGAELIADIPRGIISEDLIRQRLRIFKEKGFKTAVCGNLSALQIAIEEGFKIIAGTGLNVLNSESARLVSELGAYRVILSNEITLSGARELNSPVPKGIVAYGNIPLMLFKNCPIKNGRSCADCDKKGSVTDRKNTDFPVRCRMGYSELLNSVPLWLADREEDLKAVDFAVLYFTAEPQNRVLEVLEAYKKGLACDTEYTRGLFYRGTI